MAWSMRFGHRVLAIDQLKLRLWLASPAPHLPAPPSGCSGGLGQCGAVQSWARTAAHRSQPLSEDMDPSRAIQHEISSLKGTVWRSLTLGHSLTSGWVQQLTGDCQGLLSPW